MAEIKDNMQLRLLLAFLGAAAGIAFYLLFKVLPEVIENARLVMFMTGFLGAFSGGLLLLLGQLGLKRATGYALIIALVASILHLWASFRFAEIGGYMEAIHPVFAAFLLAHLPLPFALANETSPKKWRDYQGLFDNAWSLVVRALTAWTFVGLFWLVLLLSDQLLELVGFTYLGLVFDFGWIGLPLTGLVLGLALAVLNEMTSVVLTLRRLALQLLRLLLPLVAVVVALFIVLVPFRGLENVFGSLSAAGTMLAMAAGAVTLITSAVDSHDEDAAQSRLMVTSAKVLSVLLPIIAAIAVYALWLRVGQYGWTPARLFGLVVSIVVLAYALAYAGAVLRRHTWRQNIRRANTGMAVGVIALSAIWLTPVLNVERISANSHLARFVDGDIGVKDLDIWRLGKDWGQSGKSALEELRDIIGHPEQEALEARLRRFDDGESRYVFEQSATTLQVEIDRKTLQELLPVLPQASEMPASALAAIPDFVVTDLLLSCQSKLPDGAPGCVAAMGAFSHQSDAKDFVLFWRLGGVSKPKTATLEQDQQSGGYHFRQVVRSIGGDVEALPGEALIARIQRGDFTFAPARINALEIGDIQILPRD